MSGKRLGACLATAAALGAAVLTAPAPATASGASTTKVGAWSKDWAWFDAAVGPVDVYRGYDTGFHFARWQNTDAYRAHPDAKRSDYSFNLPPADVAAGRDDVALKTFIASTPKNIVLTNYHEPEQEIEAGLFTASDFRKAIVHLNNLVDARNTVDGGTRQVSIVLMIGTFTGFKQRHPSTYWSTVSGDGGRADLISVDAYALPHATGTTGVPTGYTDGVGWKNAQTLLQPALAFANANGVPWGISELGYLEDVNDAKRKSRALTDAVNYARAGKETPTSAKPAKPAEFIEYWDSRGGRADWQLRHSNPPFPSTSSTSNAVQAWKAAVKLL